MKNLSSWQILLLAGLLAGALIVYVDNFAFQGEASPILIVFLLFCAASAAGAVWKWRAWLPAALAWLCAPAAHLVKHTLGLADTLHPNTLASILMLAVFTLVIAALGTLFGALALHPALKKAA